MDNTREKLIEILSKPIYPHELVDPIEAVADYLLDNGVTVQKWIPVTERLPEPFVDVIAFFGGQEMNVDCVDNKGRWYSSYMGRDDPTHWMHLPEPPKGE